MPYDTNGRWVPPDDAEGDWADWDRMSNDEFQRLIDSGQLEGVGLADMNAVRSRFNTEDWRNLNDRKRIDVIKEFQDAYHGDRSNFSWGEDDRASEEWGLDIRRTSNSSRIYFMLGPAMASSILWEVDIVVFKKGWHSS